MTISTSSSPKYWQTTFLPTKIASDGGLYVDILGDALVDLVTSITTTIPYTVKEGDQLTTICYQFYQNTSLYYLVLYYNGLLFWDEVQPGDILQIPSLSQINLFFGRNRQQIGQRVTI